ncbi:MAG: hypothetical protein ACRD8K_10130 [Nitrososphaeraceae archaeon]
MDEIAKAMLVIGKFNVKYHSFPFVDLTGSQSLNPDPNINITSLILIFKDY